MSEENRIPKSKMTSASLAAAAALKWEPTSKPAVRNLRLVPPPQQVPPKLMPKWFAVSLGLSRFVNIASVSLSIPDDSGRAFREYIKQKGACESEITRVIHEIQTLEERLKTLRKSPSHLVITNPDEAIRTSDAIKETELRIEFLEMQRELLELLLKKIEASNSMFGESDVNATITNARIHFLESQLNDFPDTAAAKWKYRRGIVASANGASQGSVAATQQDSKKKDWESLAASGDNLAFARAEEDFIQGVRAEVVARIDANEDASTILAWYERSVMPEVIRVSRLSFGLAKTPDEHKVFHDVRNRLLHLVHGIPMRLKAGHLDLVKAACKPPERNLQSIFQNLQSRFATETSMTQVGLGGLRLAPHVDLEAFMAIMTNLVGNAADHPSQGSHVTPLRLQIQFGALFVHDRGAGMHEDALVDLQNGVRIHNGRVVDLNDHDNDHGFGFQIIRQNAGKLGIEIEVDSEPEDSEDSTERNHGTTVALIFPDGMIEPDPVEYVLVGNSDKAEVDVFIHTMTYERRIEVIKEMNLLVRRVSGEHIQKLMNMKPDYQDLHHAETKSREIADRFLELLEMLARDLPHAHPSVSWAYWNSEILFSFSKSQKSNNSQ